MTDAATKKPFRVSTDKVVGPYLMVPVNQLTQVRSLLDRHGINYWLNESAVSLDGRTFIAVVNFGRAGDANRVQAILDTVP
jgi:hypothetical protein